MSIKKLSLVILITLSITNSVAFSANDTPSTTSSAGNYTVLAPLPCIEGNGIKCGSEGNGSLQETVTFETYVQYTMNLLIALAAVWAVVMIVWAGIGYMIATTVSGKGASLSRFWNAIWGIVLILCSYLIMRTIDPRFVEIPNTLVPTIQLKNISTNSTGMDLLMSSFESYIKENRGTELGNRLLQIKNNLKEKEDQLKILDEKIKSYGPTPDQNNPEYQKLLASRQLALTEYQVAVDSKIIGGLDVELNGSYSESVSTFQNSSYSIPNKFKQLNAWKDNVDVIKERILSSNRTQQTDIKTLREIYSRTEMAKARIDIMKARLIIADIKSSTLSYYDYSLLNAEKNTGDPGINNVLYQDTVENVLSRNAMTDTNLRRTKQQLNDLVTNIKEGVLNKASQSEEKQRLITDIEIIEKEIQETNRLKDL